MVGVWVGAEAGQGAVGVWSRVRGRVDYLCLLSQLSSAGLAALRKRVSVGMASLCCGQAVIAASSCEGKSRESRLSLARWLDDQEERVVGASPVLLPRHAPTGRLCLHSAEEGAGRGERSEARSALGEK